MNPEIEAAKQIDLLALISARTQLRKVAAHEWAGPCPRCGGHDRFRVDPTKGWFCRVCFYNDHWNDAIDFVMWADGLDFKRALLRLVGKNDITPAELERRAAERKAADDKRLADEAAKRNEVITALNTSGVIEQYHQHPQAVSRWIDRGLSEPWVNYYRLGYCPAREFSAGDSAIISDSLTIPYWRARLVDAAYEWSAINMRHRLLATDAPGGKYRPHLAGAGNNLFYTDPMTQSLFGDVLIVEGEIKAMVTWAALWEDDNPLAPGLFVIGLPGKSWKVEFISELEGAARVFICLDPDAGSEAARLASSLGRERCKIVNLPDKVDDLINAGIMTGAELLTIMEW